MTEMLAAQKKLICYLFYMQVNGGVVRICEEDITFEKRYFQVGVCVLDH